MQAYLVILIPTALQGIKDVSIDYHSSTLSFNYNRFPPIQP